MANRSLQGVTAAEKFLSNNSNQNKLFSVNLGVPADGRLSSKTLTDTYCAEIDAARRDGEFQARMFFQSLLDHGSAMSRKEAGEAFIDSVTTLGLAFRDSVDVHARSVAFVRKDGFLGIVGEMLWELAEEQRRNYGS